jgi:hypothetical protein
METVVQTLVWSCSSWSAFFWDITQHHRVITTWHRVISQKNTDHINIVAEA